MAKWKLLNIVKTNSMMLAASWLLHNNSENTYLKNRFYEKILLGF